MLVIYDDFKLGGIETFFVRLAKQRSLDGLITKFIFLSKKELCDNELLTNVSKYAEVYYSEDIFNFPLLISKAIPVLCPLNIKKINNILQDIDHIHVTCGLHALIAFRMRKEVKKELNLTVGFYHSLEFSWNDGYLPFFEKINRKFVLNTLPKNKLFLYSETIVNFYKEKNNVDLSKSQTFRLGVIENKNIFIKKYLQSSSLKICSVGRLVKFKSYNLWMLEVVKDLFSKGIDVCYDIYGDGPLFNEIKNKINEMGLEKLVKLKGILPYSEFHQTVLQYDLFIGSGTSIIEASSLGVCSIIGIESIGEPKTYGYFSSFSNVDYNLSYLSFKKIDVLDLILDFNSLDINQKMLLSSSHIESVIPFYINVCSDNFESSIVNSDDEYEFKIPKIRYSLSFLITRSRYKIFGVSYYDRTRKLS